MVCIYSCLSRNSDDESVGSSDNASYTLMTFFLFMDPCRVMREHPRALHFNFYGQLTTVRLKTPVNRALRAYRGFRRGTDFPKTLKKNSLPFPRDGKAVAV